MQLIHGDCLEVMKDIPDGSVDMILCDLPYGTTACKWDTIIPFKPLWIEYSRIIKINGAIVLTASQPFTSCLIISNMDMFKYTLVWEKSHPSGIAMVNKRFLKYHEDICIFYKKQPTYNPQKWEGEKSHSVGKQLGNKTNSKSNPNMVQTTTEYSNKKHPKSIIKIPNPRFKGMHPTQKPVLLMEYLIKTYTNENDLIMDNCMGSGTTGIACKKINRHFIGIELDLVYFQTAKDRISNLKIKHGLF